MSVCACARVCIAKARTLKGETTALGLLLAFSPKAPQEYSKPQLAIWPPIGAYPMEPMATPEHNTSGA
eukprot:15445033-Alexandrium_andersonii.AAC.1